jgi:ketosteroid isomerase-like protein
MNDMNDDPALAANKKLALDFLNLAFANRVQAALDLLSADASWWVLGDPQRLKVSGSKNRKQIERLLNGLTQAIPGGMQIVVHGITAERDRVAVEVESEGMWHNGKRYHNYYHFLIEIRAGAILQVREYMDTLHVSDMLAG